MPSRRTVRLITAVALLLGLALSVPAVRFRQLVAPVRSALEAALDRRVEVSGPVRLRLLPSPVIMVAGVVIHDDPAFGVEPIAYVESAELGVNPLPLLAGRLTLSSLRLIEPSVNLMKTREGSWNYPTLLNRAFANRPAERPRLPRIVVSGGRLNFKSGDTKSVFYLSGVNLDLHADQQSDDTLRFRFSASPARTDRAAQGFGRFSGNGRFQYVAGDENRAQLVARLERSAIPDILTLLQGHGSGLGGFLASRAEIEGPLSNLRIRGDLELADIDRRFTFPPRSGKWSLKYSGRLDLTRQELRARTLAGNSQVPLSFRILLRDYFADTQWATVVTADTLRLETLSALAAEMGSPILPGLSLRGELSGAFSRSADGRFQGHFRAKGIELKAPDGESLQIDQAEVVSEEGVVSVRSAEVTVDERRVATVHGSYDRNARRLEIGVQARQLSFGRFRDIWSGMTGYPVPSVLTRFQGGDWSGDLLFAGTPREGEWSGDAVIEGARVRISGLSETVEIARASSPASGDDIELEAVAGPVAFGARLREGKPLELRLPQLDVVELESLLQPALDRRQGLLARTLRRRATTVPRWLSRRNVTANIHVGRLIAGPLRLYDLAGRLYWDGPVVKLHLTEADARPGRLEGRLRADLKLEAPRYHLAAQVERVPWAGGELNAEGRLNTFGTGLGLVTRARAEGSFSIRAPRTAGFAHASGCYEFRFSGALPALDFPCLTLHTREQTYYGWGSVHAGGRVALELFNDAGLYRGAGRLDPFQLTIEPLPAATLE